MDKNEGCSIKHFKLACWIIGIVLAVCVTVSAGIVQAQMRSSVERIASMDAAVQQMDSRLRQQEQASAAVMARLDNVQRTLEKMDAKLDSRNARP